jgi:adenylate cyclase
VVTALAVIWVGTYSALGRPERVVGVLDEVFSAFDRLAERHGLEKIKTIGDAYMVAAGLPAPRADHSEAMAEMAVDMLEELANLRESLGLDLAIRIGMEAARSSPASSAGTSSPKTYGATPSTGRAAWSRTVSRAGFRSVRRSTSACETATVFEERGEIEVKGKGRLRAYLLILPAQAILTPDHPISRPRLPAR